MPTIPILLIQIGPIDEATKLGFTFAKEVASNLITLSTGLLTLSITFARDVIKSIPKGREHLLKAAWGVHILAICFGVWTLMALTGNLMPVNPSDRSYGFAENVRVPASAQVAAFVLGTILLATVYWGKHRQEERRSTFRLLRMPLSQDLMTDLDERGKEGWDIVSILPSGIANEYFILLKKAGPS